MNSLKEHLNSYIRVNGQVSYNTIKDLVENGYWGKRYRMETATRRLRNESPEVEAVCAHGYIIAYKWIGTPAQKVVYKVLDEKGSVEKVITLTK